MLLRIVLEYFPSGLNKNKLSGALVYWLRLLHNFIQQSLNSCSNPACRVSEIRDGEDLLERSRLEVKLNTFRLSTMPQNNSSSSSSSLATIVTKYRIPSCLTNIKLKLDFIIFLKYLNSFYEKTSFSEK